MKVILTEQGLALVRKDKNRSEKLVYGLFRRFYGVGEDEASTSCIGRVYPDISPEFQDDLFADGQSQTCSLFEFVEFFKPVEHFVLHLGRDATP